MAVMGRGEADKGRVLLTLIFHSILTTFGLYSYLDACNFVCKILTKPANASDKEAKGKRDS